MYLVDASTFLLMLPFIFLLPEQKKNETKRKFAGYVPEAKISTFFLKKKNSLSLKQLFLLHGKTH